MACQSTYSAKEVGNCSFHLAMSRGGQPSSLHKKIRVKTSSGHTTDTSNAPGGPRNSYSVVFRFSSESDLRGFAALELMVVEQAVVQNGEANGFNPLFLLWSVAPRAGSFQLPNRAIR